MRDTLDTLTIALQVIGSGLIALLGGLDKQLTALMVLTLLNAITGLAAMRVQRRPFSSEKAITGGLKIIVYAALISMAVQMDSALGFEGIRSAMVLYLCLTLSASILENSGLCGVPVPNWISELIDKGLEKIRGDGK